MTDKKKSNSNRKQKKAITWLVSIRALSFADGQLLIASETLK